MKMFSDKNPVATRRRSSNSGFRKWVLIVLGVVLTAALPGGFAAAAHAQPAAPTPAPYPVPRHFLIDAINGALQGPSASPPGTNDWSCTPTPEHPEPVILIHGLLANRNDNWQTYGPLLANQGYCVFALTYGSPDGNPDGFLGGLAPMEAGAAALDVFVDRVRQSTGAAKVALVGHSEGATMPYWYLKFGGAAKVSRMIGLASAVHGVGVQVPDGVDIGSSAPAQLLSNSEFLHQLQDGGITAPGVAYTQIVTRYDEVVPYTSGLIHEPGVTNHVLQDLCPDNYADHLSINSDPVTSRLVLNALDPANARAPECTLVLPAIGLPPTGSGLPPA